MAKSLQHVSVHLAPLLSSFVPLQRDEKDLHLQLCIDDSVSERVFIKFAHMVEVWETMRAQTNNSLK
jgi:hypothetical protein